MYLSTKSNLFNNYYVCIHNEFIHNHLFIIITTNYCNNVLFIHDFFYYNKIIHMNITETADVSLAQVSGYALSFKTMASSSSSVCVCVGVWVCVCVCVFCRCSGEEWHLEQSGGVWPLGL